MAAFDYNAEAELFPNRGIVAGPSVTDASLVLRKPFVLLSRNFPHRPLLAPGLKSAKRASTPLVYAAYTSTLTIPGAYEETRHGQS